MLSGALPDSSSWYKDQYRIFNEDIDFQQELRLSALLAMMQETAWNHAILLKAGNFEDGSGDIFWVLSRMRVELAESGPRWKERAVLATNPTGIDKYFALRDFEAACDDGRVFARATSSWVLVNSATRKLQRPEAFLSHRNDIFTQRILTEPAPKLKERENYEKFPEQKPAYEDIDYNKHMNNTKYTEWCLATIGLEFFETHRLRTFAVNFLAELSWGESARVLRFWDEATCTYCFKIEKTVGMQAAALVELGWEKRN